MATQQDRVETIIAILNSSTAMSGNINKIRTEYKQIVSVERVTPPKRKNILKVLHATRALDSTLKTILDHFGIRNGKYAIGQYILRFEEHTSASLGNISSAETRKYQRTIAKVRNDYMHQADSYPRNDSEVYQLISEMQTLIARVTSL